MRLDAQRLPSYHLDMEYLESARAFSWGVVRRFWWMLPAALVDPFDLLNLFWGISYRPNVWVVWPVFSAGLFVAGLLTFHDLRMKGSQAAPDTDDVEQVARLLREQHLDTVLLENAEGLATGIDYMLFKGVRDRQKLSKAISELVIAAVIRTEYRPGTSGGGITQTMHEQPQTVYHLTELGGRVVRRLREERS